jgi:hypothetical protein
MAIAEAFNAKYRQPVPFKTQNGMSAGPPKADIRRRRIDVC